jgi:hypothetical protein
VAGFFLARQPRYPQIDEGVGKSASPVLAAAASWMDTMKMPLREVYKTYTKSEMAIQAWRSGEVAFNMRTQRQEGANNRATNALDGANLPPTAAEEALERRLGPDLVAKLDEEMDMRKLTGDEVQRYMGALGIPIGGRMVGVPLPTTNEALQGLKR